MLFFSLIPSGIGFVLFMYGRKQQRWPHLVSGLVFMVYPYFTPSLALMSLTGVAIAFVLWYGVVRLGW